MNYNICQTPNPCKKPWDNNQSAWAARFQSDRTLNSNSVIAPPWNQVDSTGRPTCYDGFRSETAGGLMPSRRVGVENIQRPTSFSQVGISSYGLEQYEPCHPTQDFYVNLPLLQGEIVADPLAFHNQLQRARQFQQLGFQVMENKRCSGF